MGCLSVRSFVAYTLVERNVLTQEVRNAHPGIV